MSKKENRAKAAKALERGGKSSAGLLGMGWKRLSELANDLSALNDQNDVDKEVKKKSLKKK